MAEEFVERASRFAAAEAELAAHEMPPPCEHEPQLKARQADYVPGCKPANRSVFSTLTVELGRLIVTPPNSTTRR